VSAGTLREAAALMRERAGGKFMAAVADLLDAEAATRGAMEPFAEIVNAYDGAQMVLGVEDGAA
jgi:hypothetical protein